MLSLSVTRLQVCFDVRDGASPLNATSTALKITFGPTRSLVRRHHKRHYNCDEQRVFGSIGIH